MKQNKWSRTLMVGLALLVSATLWSGCQEKKIVPEKVAVIGDHKITVDEWEQELKTEYGKTVLNKMIDQYLVYQKAEKLGIEVSEEEIQLEWDKLLEQRGESDRGLLSEQLGLSEEQVREELRYSLLLEELAMKDIHITDAEIEDYYQENQEQFIIPDKLNLHQIVVETEEDAQQVIEELEAGSEFSTLAKERSIDILHAGNGGEMGWVSMDTPYADPSVLEAASELPLNQISEPISIGYGYAVIKVTDKKEGREKPLDEVKRDIRRELAFQETEPLPQFLQRLREEADVQILIEEQP